MYLKDGELLKIMRCRYTSSSSMWRCKNFIWKKKTWAVWESNRG